LPFQDRGKGHPITPIGDAKWGEWSKTSLSCFGPEKSSSSQLTRDWMGPGACLEVYGKKKCLSPKLFPTP